MFQGESFEGDPFVTYQAEVALRQLWGLLRSQWKYLATADLPVPYGDDIPVRERLNRADLNSYDIDYLVDTGAAINPETPGLVRLRALLLATENTGVTPTLIDCIFELLPTAEHHELDYYSDPRRLYALRALYLIMLRSGFWEVQHDTRATIDTLRLGIDPLNIPEHTTESFLARQRALQGIETITDSATHMHWNVLQVMPRMVDEDVAAFLRAYGEWADDQIVDDDEEEEDY